MCIIYINLHRMCFESELCPIILSGTPVLILLAHFFSNGIIKSPWYYFSEFHCCANSTLCCSRYDDVMLELFSSVDTFWFSGLPESVQGLNIDMQRSWYRTLDMVKLQVCSNSLSDPLYDEWWCITVGCLRPFIQYIILLYTGTLEYMMVKRKMNERRETDFLFSIWPLHSCWLKPWNPFVSY